MANHAQSWGFTVFAVTAVFGAIMITLSGRGGSLRAIDGGYS
ncbi:hypothetical protein AB0L53_50685 [Nonomuraea sp. NPDC052129]